MQNLREFFREAEEDLIQLNLVKARIAKEYTKQVKLAPVANKGTKIGSSSRGGYQGAKGCVQHDSFHREKLFGESAKKKKAVDKDKTNKEEKIDNETLALESKRARIMPWKKTLKPV